MKTIKVELSRNSYEVQIGAGLLREVGIWLPKLGFQNRVIIITNPTVERLWGESLQSGLREAGFHFQVMEVPDGEEYKSLEQAGLLYEWLAEIQAERMTPILALGGGVIGDLAGFVASTYMRGVPLIQLPTTLLAQVDSSTGGKVAVNHNHLKNMIGSFYQPRLVLADIEALTTLPESEFQNGLAELIKHGLILDKGLFQMIESGLPLLKSLDLSFLEEVVAGSVGIKAGVVMHDERDTGPRNILNYGHTVGHAVETVSDFNIKHGAGVSIGMVAAGRISEKMGLLSNFESARIEAVLQLAGLPVKIPGLDPKHIMEAVQHDKKKVGGRLRFILLKAIGESFIDDDISPELIGAVLKELG